MVTKFCGIHLTELKRKTMSESVLTPIQGQQSCAYRGISFPLVLAIKTVCNHTVLCVTHQFLVNNDTAASPGLEL